jgi:hypothetical protein
MLAVAIFHRYAIIALFKPVMCQGKRGEVCGECGMYSGDAKCMVGKAEGRIPPGRRWRDELMILK